MALDCKSLKIFKVIFLFQSNLQSSKDKMYTMENLHNCISLEEYWHTSVTDVSQVNQRTKVSKMII